MAEEKNAFHSIFTNVELIEEFLSSCKRELGIQQLPRVFFIHSPSNSSKTLAKTAFYDPQQRRVGVYITGRHFKDILRSLAHELVHHHQNENGRFDEAMDTSPGYAQKDERLRELESDAYLRGNFLIRDFEDIRKMKMENKQPMNKKLIAEAVVKAVKLHEEKIKNKGKYADGAKAKAGVDDDGDGVPDGADKDPKNGAVKETVEPVTTDNSSHMEKAQGSVKDEEERVLSERWIPTEGELLRSKKATLNEELMKWALQGDK